MYNFDRAGIIFFNIFFICAWRHWGFPTFILIKLINLYYLLLAGFYFFFRFLFFFNFFKVNEIDANQQQNDSGGVANMIQGLQGQVNNLTQQATSRRKCRPKIGQRDRRQPAAEWQWRSRQHDSGTPGPGQQPDGGLSRAYVALIQWYK